MPEGTPAADGGQPNTLEALVASRQPQGNVTQAQPAQPGEPTQPSGEQVPPWERDGQEFNPERAWNLITSLRSERETLRGEREQLAGEVSQFRNSQMTDQQRLEAERDQLRTERDTAASELTRLRVAVRHGLSEEDFDLLGSGSEEEIETRAQRIAALRASQTPPVPSFDGGARTSTEGADMNDILRRRLRG